ncbi:MAG: hypothetical protein ABWJ42_00805 [Sulfolobales archaeon]
MKNCVRFKIIVEGSQALIETEDGKKAVVPLRIICELVRRYNLCREDLGSIKC